MKIFKKISLILTAVICVFLMTACGGEKNVEGTLEDFLLKDARTNTSKVVKEGTPNSKKAVLHYKKRDEHTVEIELVTGRHHQIRVQMAHAGAPVAGDRKYGQCEDGKFRNTALFSSALEFVHPITGQSMRFESKPVADAFEIFS